MQLLRLKDVEQKTGLSKTTIYEYMNSGQFPKSINLGVRAVAWLESEVEDWIDSRNRTTSYSERWLSEQNQQKLLNTVFRCD